MRIFAAFAGLLILVSPHGARADECEPLTRWLALRNDARSSPDTERRIQAARGLRASLREAASQWFSLYRSGNLQPGARERCLPSDARQDFSFVFPRIFLDETLKELRTVPASPTLARLLGRWDDVVARTGIFPFRFVVETPDLGIPGGFDRGKRSLFLNYEQVPPQEWSIIFVHEITHAVDPYLDRAVAAYQDRSVTEEIAAYGQTGIEYDALPLAARELLIQWLRAGLDRGLLGEVRAWDVTKSVYEEGRQSGAFSRLPWLDSLGGSPDTGAPKSQRARVLRDLDPRFSDPAGGLLSLRTVKAALASLRAELLLSGDPTPSALDDTPADR